MRTLFALLCHLRSPFRPYFPESVNGVASTTRPASFSALKKLRYYMPRLLSTFWPFPRLVEGSVSPPAATAAVWPDVVPLPPPKPPLSMIEDGCRVTYIGHGTILLQLEGLNIVTDPNFSLRMPLWGGFRCRRRTQPGVAIENLPTIDAILLSHDHCDSYDKPSVSYITKRDRSTVFTGTGMSKYLRRRCANLYTMPWWEETAFCNTWIRFVPAIHASGRIGVDTHSTLWGGFVLSTQAFTIYFAGDTGYGEHFEQIREMCETEIEGKRIDLAILPIGGYAPEETRKVYNMTPEEAVQAHIRLNAIDSLAISYDTFPRGGEGYGEAPRRLVSALAKYAVSPQHFHLMRPGEHLQMFRA